MRSRASRTRRRMRSMRSSASLAAGRLSDGIGVAIHRLVAMGLRPRLRIAAGSSQLAVRLAATCAIPLSPRDLETLVSTVAKPFVSVDSSQEAP